MAKLRYTRDQVVNALEECKGMIYLAARRLGCHPNTVSNYMRRYPAVRDVVTAKRGEMVDTAEIALHKAIQGGEGWAVCFTLKTLGKERGYVERQEFAHHGKDDAPPIRVESASTHTLDWSRIPLSLRVEVRDTLERLRHVVDGPAPQPANGALPGTVDPGGQPS